MEEKYIEFALENSIKQLVNEKISEEIKEKVRQFENQLLDRKDKYIAEVMKGIRILHEKNQDFNEINYKIIFENIQRIEVNK